MGGMAPIILTLDTITRQYAEAPLLDGVSLAIEAGQRIGVVGVNGSGKTTLLKIAAGVEPPDSGRITTARGLRIAYLPQNPELDPHLSVIDQLFRGDTPEMRLLHDHAAVTTALAADPSDAALQRRAAELVEAIDAHDAWALEHAARSILSRLGITDLGAPTGALSGGQRRRVAMAAALINPVDLLILDEPTNQIDTVTIAWLEEYLQRMRAALLLVTHDRYFLDRVVERIVEVENGKLYSYPGAYARFLELKAERLAQQASDEQRRQTILRRELAWLRRGAQARTTKQQARIDRIDTLRAEPAPQERGALEISVASRRLGKKVIELQGVGKSFGERTLFGNISLSVAPRDRIGIIGPNGSGKSTLLNLIAGRLTPDTGAIEYGETVHLGYYDQEAAGLDDTQRAIDYVREGAEILRTGDGGLATAAQMLERFLFPSSAHYTPIGRLSGGERRRLYLLRILIDAPNVLLLDEPTNDLDIQTLTVLEEYLETFAGALIVVSHDRYFLDRAVERTLAFEEGVITEYPGGYQAYAEAVARRAPPADAAPTKPKPAAAREEPARRRLSFKEARELRDLEGRIAALEAQQAQLEEEIAAGNADYQALTHMSHELTRVGAELEAAFERWAELAEIAEGG
jgi:ATP-binding cassette subfamily F protein uup